MDKIRESKGQRLNWRQACGILGCGRTRFYALVKSGRLPAYRTQGGKRGMWVYDADCRALVERVARVEAVYFPEMKQLPLFV